MSYFLLNWDLLQVFATAKITESMQFFNVSYIFIFVLIPRLYFYLCHLSYNILIYLCSQHLIKMLVYLLVKRSDKATLSV